MKLLLVDSSAWIGAFSKHPPSSVVRAIVDSKKNKNLATCGMICLEVLRGSRTEKEFSELREEFEAMHWLPITDGHWDLASHMGFQLQKKGFKPPATDLLISAVCIENRCQLLHQDKHFKQIAQYFPLRLF